MRLAPEILESSDFVRKDAHVLTSRGCRFARSVALAQSPVSMYQNNGGRPFCDLLCPSHPPEELEALPL